MNRPHYMGAMLEPDRASVGPPLPDPPSRTVEHEQRPKAQRGYAPNFLERHRRPVVSLLVALLIAGLVVCEAASTEVTVACVKIMGLGLLFTGPIGRLWSTLYIGDRKAKELVQAGPYSITRNPLYLFSAIGATGAGAQIGSMVVALACGIGTWIIFHFLILREERYLHEAFGETYDAYCKRVPRFLPRLASFDDVKWLSVTPKRVYSTFGDGLFFFTAIPAAKGIAWLHACNIVPILLRLP